MILDDDPDIEIDWDGSGRRPVLRGRLGNAMHIVLMKHNKGTAQRRQSNRLVLPHHCPPIEARLPCDGKAYTQLSHISSSWERTPLSSAHTSFPKADSRAVDLPHVVSKGMTVGPGYGYL